ncbi:hypothetical protein, partial [Chromobacterium vaccinii]|uniref:hypothetical protein n=1 Tax=Chromobacterium vaccinii TaxID=1108595 RepID=UPI001E598D66
AQLQGEQALVLIEGGGEGGKQSAKVHGAIYPLSLYLDSLMPLRGTHADIGGDAATGRQFHSIYQSLTIRRTPCTGRSVS